MSGQSVDIEVEENVAWRRSEIFGAQEADEVVQVDDVVGKGFCFLLFSLVVQR